MPEASILVDLQKRDSELDRLSVRLNALADIVGLTAAEQVWDKLTARMSGLEKQLKEIHRRQRSLEGELGVVESKIAKEEKRLYGGTITNPKELSGLQSEVASLKRKRDGLETEILQVMEEAEPPEVEFERLRRTLTEAESRRAAAQAEYDRESAEIGKEVDALRQEREGLAEKLSSGTRSLYETLRKDKAGLAVALLEGETCGGCRVEIPSGEAEAVRKSSGPARCPNCRRILIPRHLLLA